MKTTTLSFLFILGILIFTTLTSRASEADSTKVEKKVIKIVKVDDSGTVMIDSTYTIKDGKVTVHIDSARYDRPPFHKKEMRMKHGNRMMMWNDEKGNVFNMEIQERSKRFY